MKSTTCFSSSSSILALLALVASASGAAMDQATSATPAMIAQFGEPMCCNTALQCTEGFCDEGDMIKTQIPGPIVIFSLACASDNMMTGWCPVMDPEPTGLPGGSGGSGGGQNSGAVSGDPHFKTWSGEWFDFHGECDMVLVNAPSFHNGLGLQIQIRSKLRYGYSFIETAAVQIGDDVLTVSSYGEFAFSGISGALPESVGGFPIIYQQQGAHTSIFRIPLEGEEELVIKTFKDMVNVNLSGTNMEDFGDSVGLLGGYGTGSKLARDGSTVLANANEFGMEWQVRPSEDGSLFDQARHPQFPVQCIMPDANQEESRRLRGAEVSDEAAELACKHHADAGDRARCVFDVLATQDLDLAAAGAF